MQGGVPGEVGQAVGRGAVAGDPVVHPGQAGRGGRRSRSARGPGRGRSGRRSGSSASEVHARSIASSKRRCSWRTNASSPAYHQSLPYAGAARSTIAHASSGTSVTPANAIVGTAVDSSSASRGVGLEVGDQRSGVAADVRGDRVHVAALALGAAPGVQAGVARAGRRRRPGAQLVAEQRQRGVGEGEGRVEGDGGGHRTEGTARGAGARRGAAGVRRRPLPGWW